MNDKDQPKLDTRLGYPSPGLSKKGSALVLEKERKPDGRRKTDVGLSRVGAVFSL